MQVGSLKGTALRLCALSSVICFFLFFKKDNRTVKLYHDFLPDRTADGEFLLTFSTRLSSTFEEVPRLIKNLVRGTETCRTVRSLYN